MDQLLHILIANNNDKDVELIKRTVVRAGFNARFAQAHDRQELLSLLPRQHWDLVLCECQIGEMTAQAIIALLKQRKLMMPIIVVCFWCDPGDELVVELMHAGAHDFVGKRDLSRLVPAIERELAEQAQHQQVEEALHETEARFLQLSRNIEEVFWLIDTETFRTVYLSPSFEEIWERPAQLMLASPDFLYSTIHPEDVDRIQQAVEENGWHALNHNYRIILADGAERWIHTRCFVVQDDKAGSSRVAGVSTDITEQKRLEHERDMMTRALEQSADAVLITDAQIRIVYVNAAFEDLSGYSKEELIGKDPSLLRSGFQDDEFYQHLWNSLTNGIPFMDVFINRRKDGELYYEAKTITPLRGKDGELTHFVSTGKDITHRLKDRQRFQRVMHYDVVTGLANRALLHDRLYQGILQASRLHSRLGVICFEPGLSGVLDDSCERRLYEQMMRLVAQRLLNTVNGNTTVARLGGDVFAILLKNIQDDDQIEQMMHALNLAFAQPLQTDGYELFIRPHAGISVCPDHGDDVDELLEHAELAMQLARHQSEQGYLYYHQNMCVTPARPHN
jgi:PAS domain S-box-containing protein/diguanylate cyclase (GGDEF)-like protein